MAEEKSSELKVPENTHFSEWGIGEVLLALTGDQVDFRSAANQSWIKFDTDASGGAWDKSKPNSALIQYHAWDKLYYAASYNDEAFKAWDDLCLKMDAIANDLATGQRGSLDVQSVFDAEERVKLYEQFLMYSASDFRAWAKNLDQDGSKFQGQAASVIQRRMDTYADAQEDVHKQVTDNYGIRVSSALGDLRYELSAAIAAITNTWWQVSRRKLVGIPQKTAYSSVSKVTKFITDNGLVAPKSAHPQYQLDEIDDRDEAEKVIRSWLASTDYGNVMTADAWNKMNDEVNKKISSALDELDTAAREAMANLHPALVTATTALTALVEPTPSNSSGGGGGSMKPPPEVKIPPPPEVKIPPPPEVKIPPPPKAEAPPLPDPNGGGSGGFDGDGKPLPDPNGKSSADGGAPLPVPPGPTGVFTKSKQPGANGGGSGGFDENGKPLPGFDGNGKPLPGFDGNGKPLPGFDGNGKPLPGFDGNGKPLPGFDGNGKPLADGGAPLPVPPGPTGVFTKSKQPGANGGGSGGFDENGKPLPGFDDNGKPLPGFDSTGHPLPGFDSTGHPLPGFDKNGQPLPGFDSNGHPLPGFDDNGKPLPGFDSTGHPLPGFDSTGHPLPGFDDNGKPLPGFDSTGHPLPGFDSTGHPLPGFDSTGHPLPGFDSNGDPLPGFDSDGKPLPGSGSGSGSSGSGAGFGAGPSLGAPAPVVNAASPTSVGSGLGGGTAGPPAPPAAVLSGGWPGTNGNNGIPGSGMMPPMMPPMMGGMGGAGGAGNDQKERERQTWLSEDEEVWGVNDAAGLSVIGRPDEESYEFDESIVAAGPIRGPRQPAQQPAEDEQDAETATRNA